MFYTPQYFGVTIRFLNYFVSYMYYIVYIKKLFFFKPNIIIEFIKIYIFGDRFEIIFDKNRMNFYYILIR